MQRPLSPPAPEGPHPVQRQRLLLALVFCFSSTDFLQSGIVAFNAAPIMGAVAASPEEYSSVAMLYALFAILAIYKQRWLVERLGWRLFAQLSMGVFAAGSLLCAFSSSLHAFATGRILMALGGATAFTMGRVIVSHLPSPPARFTGIRFFATGLGAGSLGGPLLAGAAWAQGSWRYAFLALALPALLIALLSTLALPRVVTAPDRRSQPHPKALVLLMLGSILALHALQRSAFDWFADAPVVLASAAAAMVALLLFIFSEHGHRQPPLHLPALVQRRFLLGLGAFTIAYAVLGANNYVLPLLIRQGMGLPLETLAPLLATGALGSLLTWQLMALALQRHMQPLPYYLAGFGALATCGLWLSQLSESANVWQSVAPALVLNGAFVMLTLATTALQTFQKLQHDETVFSHANQVKNMLGQFGTATGIAIGTLVMQWRSSTRYSELADAVNLASVGAQDMVARLTRSYTAIDPATAPQRVAATLGRMVSAEATFSAVTDYFFGVAVFAITCLTGMLLWLGWRRAAALARPRTA